MTGQGHVDVASEVGSVAEVLFLRRGSIPRAANKPQCLRSQYATPIYFRDGMTTAAEAAQLC